MAEVKIAAAANGGSAAIAGPPSSSANTVLKLPADTGSAGQVLAVASANHSATNAELEWVADAGTGRKVLEQFFCPCDGSVIATANGNITIVDKDNVQDLTTSYADVLGSTIAYNPPAGTTQVIYEYHLHGFRGADDSPIGHFKFWIDSDEVTDARTTFGADYIQGQYSFKWGINIGGSAVTATGRQASWSSAKTLKLTAREYGSSNESTLNQTYHWDGGASTQYHRPQIGITAIG